MRCAALPLRNTSNLELFSAFFCEDKGARSELSAITMVRWWPVYTSERESARRSRKKHGAERKKKRKKKSSGHGLGDRLQSLASLFFSGPFLSGAFLRGVYFYSYCWSSSLVSFEPFAAAFPLFSFHLYLLLNRTTAQHRQVSLLSFVHLLLSGRCFSLNLNSHPSCVFPLTRTRYVSL